MREIILILSRQNTCYASIKIPKPLRRRIQIANNANRTSQRCCQDFPNCFPLLRYCFLPFSNEISFFYLQGEVSWKWLLDLHIIQHHDVAWRGLVEMWDGLKHLSSSERSFWPDFFFDWICGRFFFLWMKTI